MSTLTEDQLALADMVIGPERRERLIGRYADRLVLRYGMAMATARRYATDLYEDGAPEMLLAVGQVWAKREGFRLPGEEMFNACAGGGSDSFTVAGFSGGMVEVGGGRAIAASLFAAMWLVAWPDEYRLDEDEPAVEETGGAPAAQEEFSPDTFGIIVQRDHSPGGPMQRWLPLLGKDYRAANINPPLGPASYVNLLDIPAYLDRHLADYRAGWADFRDQFNQQTAIGYFNAHAAPCECGIVLAAYLGQWLWQRIRSDVVTEHGGNVGDYQVVFEWAPSYADDVLALAPYADPQWELPVDHRLAQCAGQGSLLDLAPEERL